MTGWQAGNLAGYPVGLKRTAKLRTCPSCGALTLTAYTGHPGQYLITVDPTPLTTHSEAAALLAGRATYDAEIANNGSITFQHRHVHRIRVPRKHPVLADHACPGTPANLTWLPTPPDRAAAYTDDPPF